MKNKRNASLEQLLSRIDSRLQVLGMSDNAASTKAGLTRDLIRNLRRGASRELSSHAATALAEVLEISIGQLLGSEAMPEEQGMSRGVPPRAPRRSHVSPPAPAPAVSKKRTPILGLAVGGDDGRFLMNGETIDTTFCPPGLEDVPDLYAVYVSGSSMEPRFEPGETLWVHPRRPARRGAYVVVQIKGEPGEPPEGFIKKFVSWTPESLVLEQLNPPQEIVFDKSKVLSVHPIIFQGWT